MIASRPFVGCYTDIFRAIQVSVNALDVTSRERYIALAVLPEDMPAAVPVQQCLWGVNEGEAIESAEQFLTLSQRGQIEGSIHLHDLQLDYVRTQYADQEILDLVRSAVRLSSHVVDEDPGQFASQLVGRLLPHQGLPAVQQFTNSLLRPAPLPWLRPFHAALNLAGTALLRILLGHADRIQGVAVSGDGRRAVSASWDHTLKVWNVESGRELRTLTGALGHSH